MSAVQPVIWNPFQGDRVRACGRAQTLVLTLAPPVVRAVHPILARLVLGIKLLRCTLRRRISSLSIAYPPPQPESAPLHGPAGAGRQPRRVPPVRADAW